MCEVVAMSEQIKWQELLVLEMVCEASQSVNSKAIQQRPTVIVCVSPGCVVARAHLTHSGWWPCLAMLVPVPARQEHVRLVNALVRR